MTSPYELQKLAAVERRAAFDYFVAPGYDRIPVAEYYEGYGRTFDDKSQNNVYDDVHPQGDLMPYGRQNLGPHNTTQAFGGYRMFCDDHVAIDIAPVLTRRRLPQIGMIGDAIRGARAMHCGQALNTGVVVTDIGVRQPDSGLADGVLFDPPADLRSVKTGRSLYVPHP